MPLYYMLGAISEASLFASLALLKGCAVRLLYNGDNLFSNLSERLP